MRPGRQTQLKRARELAVKEKRERKLAKKHARAIARRTEAAEGQFPADPQLDTTTWPA
jgi:hypothetical protein